MASDHISILTRELARHGIKPDVSRTAKQHVRISWYVGDKRYNCLTSGTASDYRSVLNARARILRDLRTAGIVRSHKTKPRQEDHLPDEHLRARVTQLEADVATLLDLIIEVTEAPKPVASKPVKPRAPWILHHLRYDEYRQLRDIIRESGYTHPKVSMALNYALNKGLAAKGPNRGEWRKTPAADKFS